MSAYRQNMALKALREHGLVEMGVTRQWQPTGKGRELLDALDLLTELCGGPRLRATPRGMTSGESRAGRRPREGSR